MSKQKFSYYLLRTVTFPLRYLPYRWIHVLGKTLGLIAYYTIRDFRKKTCANLALATDLHLSPKQIRKLAKKSFQNFAITLLEYPRLEKEKDFSSFIHCENPQTAEHLNKKGQGLIFLCGHQANWEVLFLDGNLRMKGTAIGKPFKNSYIYRWIVSIREKTKGKIIDPKDAIKESLRTLKKGLFLGLVGDQSMPTSPYSFLFFGRNAKMSSTPALLSYKTNSPIIVATTHREKGRYILHYSDPIWPDTNIPLEKEITRLMDASLTLLQKSIEKHPDEWLWQHNVYKQQTPHRIYRPYRHESILVILPQDRKELLSLLPHLQTLKEIYDNPFFFILSPQTDADLSFLLPEQIIFYHSLRDLFLKDYRFKIVFNFSHVNRVNRHYLRYSAFKVLDIKEIRKISLKNHEDSDNLSDQLIAVLCRKGTFTKKRSVHAS